MTTEKTASDIAAIELVATRLQIVEPAARAALVGLLQVRELSRGEYLLRSGERARVTGILLSGLLREHFVTPRGVERTKAFILPMQLTGSLADLLSTEPARAFIVAERPSRLVVAPYAQIRALESRFDDFRGHGQRVAERLVLAKAEREYELLCLDAEERYAAFLARYPELDGQVADLHVASYLGMTPVHLSRLRRRRGQPAARTASVLAGSRGKRT